jgi:hypothetical protein
MIYYLKKASFGLSLIFASSAVQAESINLTLSPTSSTIENPQDAQDVMLVDRHAIFVLDLSRSMDQRETDIIYDGLEQAFNEDEFNMALESGNRYAFTFIFFGSYPNPTETFFVNNPTDAKIILRRALKDDEGNFVEPLVGNQTHMIPVIRRIEKIFNKEEENGFYSLTRAVIFIGDETPSDYENLIPLLPDFQANNQASLFCIPIVHSDFEIDENPRTHTFYRRHLQTPLERFEYIDAFGYKEYVPEGQCAFARNAREAAPTFAAALRAPGG